MAMDDCHSRSMSVRSFFDTEASRYRYERYERPSCEQLSYQFRKSLVLEMSRDFHGRVCDLGCGPGILTRALAGRGLRLVSVDLSPEMLRQGQSDMTGRCPQSSWLCGDVLRVPLVSGSVDHVICVGVLGYLPCLEGAFEEMRRVLKPGGTAIVQFSNVLCPWARVTAAAHALLRAARVRRHGDLPFRLRAYRPSQVKRLVKRLGFSVLDEASYDFRLPFVEKALPAAARRWSVTAQALARSGSLGWLGEGRLIKVRKGR